MDPIAKLKAEMEAKKRKVQALDVSAEGAGSGDSAPKKKVYRTNGQTKQLLREIGVAAQANASEHKSVQDSALSPQAAAQAGGSKKFIPKAEVIKRLRGLRAPITLFAEDDEARLERLRALELSQRDVDNEGSAGQTNFLVEEARKQQAKALKGGDSSDEDELSPEERKAKKTARLQKLLDAEEKAAAAEQALGRDQKDEAAVLAKSTLVRTWIRRTLKEWEIDIDDLPAEVLRSVQGRNEVNTYKQTKNYIKPLLQLLKTNELEKAVLFQLATIVCFGRKREYSNAADKYLILSIGKAAWPMGVTMVGIHERAAREKIFSQDVAHVLNDETQRKYIQSVKRLMTYAQNKYPPDSFTQALEPTAIDKHAPTMLKAAGKAELSGILENKFNGATDFSARY